MSLVDMFIKFLEQKSEDFPGVSKNDSNEENQIFILSTYFTINRGRAGLVKHSKLGSQQQKVQESFIHIV